MKTTILILFAMLISVALLGQIPKTNKDSSKKSIYQNCDSIVKHYADSMKTAKSTLQDSIKAAKKLEYKKIIDEQLLNNVPILIYEIGFIFIIIGVLIAWRVRARKGIKNDITTPSTFSLAYFFLRSIPKKLWGLFISILIGFVCMRFTANIFGQALTMFECLIVGFFFDNIIDLLSKIDFSKVLSFKLPITNNNNPTTPAVPPTNS